MERRKWGQIGIKLHQEYNMFRTLYKDPRLPHFGPIKSEGKTKKGYHKTSQGRLKPGNKQTLPFLQARNGECSDSNAFVSTLWLKDKYDLEIQTRSQRLNQNI